MTSFKKITFGFKATCILVGSLNIIFFLMMIAQGIMKAMAEFKVPEILLQSPHYADAMFWVFLHMAMLGVLIIIIGLVAENPIKQPWVARVLVIVFCIYLSLDIHTSDNPLGIALYHGPRSLFPIFVDIFYIILFLRLSFNRLTSTSYTSA